MATAWDAITAFLLCLFSDRLQSIYMKPYCLLVAKYSRIDMLLEQMSSYQSKMESMSLSLLSNLRSVSIAGPCPNDVRYQCGLAFKFILPFLEVVSVSDSRVSNLWNEGTTNFEFLPLTLRTASLAMLDYCLSSRSIQKILPWFHALKLFQYQYGAKALESRPHLFPPFNHQERLGKFQKYFGAAHNQ
jgi:hypothetical protein